MWKEIKERWNSKTPPFFKKIVKLGWALAALGVGILAPSVALPGFDISMYPDWVIEISKGLIGSGVVAANIAKFAKEQFTSDKTIEKDESH